MRTLHLTDLHRATEYLAPLIEREAGADLVLVGGDLTNFGGVGAARAVIEPLRRAFSEVLAVPGNVDRSEVGAWLTAEGISLHGAGRVVQGVAVSGCGGSNRTPLKAPTELSEPELDTLLRAGLRDVGDVRPWILLTHVPPADTPLDRMFAGKHVGSGALRSFLEARRPTVCLCGHIHEAVGIHRVGETLVCNPGGLNARRYAVLEVEGDVPRCELRRLEVGPVTRARAGGRSLATKVLGYARYRLGG